MAAALADADGLLDDDRAEYLAVLLRLPLRGDYAADATEDLSAVIGPLVERNRSTWLTWMRPVDVHSWPEKVILEGPTDAISIREQLRQTKMHWYEEPETRGAGLFIDRGDAVRALLTLLGDPEGLIVNDGDASVPEYGAIIQLLMGRTAERELRGRVDTVPAGETLRPCAGWLIRYSIAGVSVDVLPEDLLQQVIAYLVPKRPSHRQGIREPGSIGNSTVTPFSILQSAIENQDALLALSPLVQAGRAWLESQNVSAYRPVLQRTLETFGPESEPGVWAHYLLALDGLLQRGDSTEDAFNNVASTRADQFGVGLLYRAEEMEFARVRGDLELACRLANSILPALVLPVSTVRTDAESYVQGTSRFLFANLLRRGGRYREAEDWIRGAGHIFDTRRPAQATEELHCRYALGVCAAVQGRPILQDLEATQDGDIIFARSLVVLSNANAAWLTSDVERAEHDAAAAADGFDSIAYGRYALRARRLARLLLLWATLEKGGNLKGVVEEESALVEHILSDGEPEIDLSTYRPSSALGLLSIGLRFAPRSAMPRILLPPVITIAGDLSLRGSYGVTGFEQADAQLRQDMGLPMGTRAPLLAD